MTWTKKTGEAYRASRDEGDRLYGAVLDRLEDYKADPGPGTEGRLREAERRYRRFLKEQARESYLRIKRIEHETSGLELGEEG